MVKSYTSQLYIDDSTNLWYFCFMATKNTSVTLSDHFVEYARRKVASGEFSSISEVIRDSLRRAEERDIRIERLRTLIHEGEESGPAQLFDFDEFLKDMRANYKGAA